MTIRIGLYDFFTYTIPGYLYVFAGYLANRYFNFLNLEIQLAKLSFLHIAFILVIAYLLGYIFDYISDNIWYDRWKPKKPNNIETKALEKFKEKNERFPILLESKEWATYLGYIKKENMDVALDIEWFNVVHKMLRNVSFCLLILSVINLLTIVINKFTLLGLFTCIALFVLSIVTVLRSRKFNMWFYMMIYEAICIRSLDILDILKPQHSASESKT